VRILHLSKFYPPDPGGLEQAVAQLAEGAAARGHEVRVVSATGSSWIRDPGRRTTEPPRFNVVVVRLATKGIYWSQPISPGYLAAARWPADVVYVHRPHPLADLAVRLGPRRPTIVFHHSDVQRQRVARWLYQPLARSGAQRASRAVVATHAHLQHAEDLGKAGRAKAVVIPYGVDVRRFKPGSPAARPASFPRRNGPIGLFVGRLVGYKGLDVLLKAVAGSELRVVIAGGGPLKSWLEERTRNSDLAGRVSVVGSPAAHELPLFYQAADYFVLPSTSPAEMFGIVQLEAMACGRAVISTALGTGVDEVNVNGDTGLVVPPGDHTALRQAMETLAVDHELRARFGAEGRKRVEQLYDVERVVDRHLALCEEVVGDVGGASA
jgi:rhamnosyl/mannosyltransferase